MEQSGTVEKALDLLFHLHGEAEPQGLTAIARSVSMPKSSAHRLLGSLKGRGLVEQDGRGRYRTGIALLALGLGVLDREPLVAAARPVLERQAAELQETCFLVAARGEHLVVLDKAEGTGFLRAAPQVGSTVPVHATAVGKLYLAFAPEEVSLGDLDCFTRNTLRDAEGLKRAVEQVRTRGYADNRQEWIDGLVVLAAPIFNKDVLRGALCVAFAATRSAALEADGVAQRLMKAAARVGGRLQGDAT